MRRFVVAVMSLVAGGMLAACHLPNNLPGKEPVVSFDKLKIDQITFQKVDTQFVLDVDNPFPILLPIPKYTWDLALAGGDFASGKSAQPIKLKANKTSKVRIPVSAKFADIISFVQDVKGKDQIPFKITGNLNFKTPAGPLQLPYHAKGDFPMLHTPKFTPTRLRVDKLDIAKHTAKLAVEMKVTSDQGSNLTFPKLGYGLTLGGVQVASGDTQLNSLADETTFELPIDVDLLRLGTSIASAIEKKGNISVGFKGDADVGTPFGTIPLNINESKQVPVK